ncbi:MAG: hypothetical protein JWP36_847 [Paucimonas sp.]|jgi:hypothetical protein|nr:hypothetical protein [Paucimonas sp.]
MKAVIRQSVAGERLRDSVPPPYRDEVAKGSDPKAVYTLILCPHNRRDVVPSPLLAQALRRLPATAPGGLIIVGAVFTEEAQALAREHNARLVSMHKAKWTDESARQRQL